MFIAYQVYLSINSHYAFQENKEKSTILTFDYLVDPHSGILSSEILNYEHHFTSTSQDKIPYSLGDQTYWLKLDITNTKTENQDLVIYSDNSMLKHFDVYHLPASSPQLVEVSKNFTNNLYLYPHREVEIQASSNKVFYLRLKSNGPPNIPILVENKDAYSSLVMAAKNLYGIFIAIVLLMAIYNFVIYFAVKDNVYLAYIAYLISALIVLSSVNSYGSMIFNDNIMQLLNNYSLFFHYYLVATLLFFTLLFLRYEQVASSLYKIGLTIVATLIVLSVFSQVLPHAIQAKLFFSLQPFVYLFSIFIIFKRFNKDAKWAKYYFISWVALVIGGVAQPLVLLNIIEHTLITRNAFLIAVLVEICFMSFALAERVKRNEEDRIKDVTYHNTSGLPRKSNLETTINRIIENNSREFAVVIIKPEQIEQIALYIDDNENIELFQKLNKKLGSLFGFNDAVIPLTDKKEKLCFLNNNSLALLLETSKSSITLEQMMHSIQQFVSESFVVSKVQLPLSAVIGIAHYPNHGKHAHQLINHAQLALTQAQLNHEKWANFELQSSKESSEALQIAADLKAALDNNELSIYHQPQIDLKTLRVCSSECLLRWKHPKRGMVSPEIFIKIAEDTGLINQLTLWVVKQALEQHKMISHENGFNHMVSINISGKDLIANNFFLSALDIIERSEIAPDKIIFELTESISFSSSPYALGVIDKLCDLGITVSIDDFGTGYSSMAQISTLPFQELKIDRQFVENIMQDRRKRIITETTVRMAKGLNLEVVAEGINSEEDEKALQSFGCDIGQGYYYAKPMPINEYILWLQERGNGRISGPLTGDYIPA